MKCPRCFGDMGDVPIDEDTIIPVHGINGMCSASEQLYFSVAKEELEDETYYYDDDDGLGSDDSYSYGGDY